MQDATTSCCQSEAQTLYRPWLQANDATGNSTEPQSRNDRNLHTIAQLASLRLGTQRAIIFLIDDGSQHILSEATQNLPPSYDSSSTQHELLLSAISLLLSGQHVPAELTPHTESNDPPKPDHFISTDCRSDDRFKDHEIVKKEGGVRFAAGVPLLSRHNCTIGALVVLDKSPRDRVEDKDFLELKDYAQCIVRHLELVRSSVEHSRETKVLRGIAGCFANQYQFPPCEEKSEESINARCDINEQDPSNLELEAEGLSNLGNLQDSIEMSLQATFNEAVEVLRDCSQADGAVIFGPPAVASLMVIDEKTSPPEPDHNDSDDLPSIVLASCSRDGTAFTVQKDQRAPSVGTLHRLASIYPRGMLFNVVGDSVNTLQPTNGGRRSSGTVTATEYVVRDAHDVKEVLTMLRADVVSNLTEAQTLIFLPIYDHDNKTLLASCFAWHDTGIDTAVGHRDVTDYHVLGNFLSHSVAQLMLQNKDSEQKKFMSNFSHELRTPINGILGSAQFLQDTVSDDYQNELLQSIVVSSNTLLDTLNIVLDYTKFEHAVSEVKHPSVEEESSSALPAPVQPLYVEADVDLALLVEDATETVVAGHFFDNLPPDTEVSAAADRSYGNYLARQGVDRGTTQDVKVILQLSARPSWSVKTSPGAISRVIMNLVGNALKFTPTGNVVVELEPKTDKDASRINVRLRVQDSGIGMTDSFVKHHLFAPYRQGNPFSPGVGLGMSVLKHMVSSLHGDLSISSKVGEGTAISIDLTFNASEKSDDGIPADMSSIMSRIKGKHLVLLDINSMYEGYQSNDAVMQRVSALRSIAINWLGMRVSISADINVEDADFYLFSEPPPIDDVLERHQKAAKSGTANMEVPLVVVATDSREAHMINRHHAVSLEKTGRIVQVLSQPCGPRKLAKVLNLCQDRVEQSRKDRADKQHEDGPSANHKPSEAEPYTKRDEYGNAGDGQNVEDIDGPPSVSETKHPAKKLSRLSSDDDAEHPEEEVSDQDEGDDQSKAGKGEKEEGYQTPEDSVPKPPFTKPLVLSRSPADAAPSKRHAPKERNLHGLCVDDNKINLRLLVTLMRKERHTYEQSENGQEALEVFQASNCAEPSSDGSRKPFDFVLMDIGMPVMDGITCTKAIREHERKHNLTPTYIVACTAWGDGQTQRDAKKAGMDAFLPKPLKFAHLKGLLAGLMKHD